MKPFWKATVCSAILFLLAPGIHAGESNARTWLEKELAPGEAVIWHLHHAGWAVKTKTHLLIFDYWQETRPPERPSLDNGFIVAEEMRDQMVMGAWQGK